MKGLEARTTGQLYCVFQYFLKQRKWDINTAAEEQEFWVATMHILNTPHRTQVKFLARGPFLRAFEHAMLLAHQTWALRKEEDYSKDEVPRGMQWPNLSRTSCWVQERASFVPRGAHSIRRVVEDRR